MSRFEEVYRFDPDTPLTDEVLNKRFKDLDDRLSKAEVARLAEDTAFDVVLDRVLGRAEDVIGSLRDSLLQITQLQWLTAHSDTPRTLSVGAQYALSIIEADRALFAPGPFAALSWDGGDPEDYAVVRTLGFDRALGQWDVRVEAFVGDPGPHTAWQIAAIAGSTLAQLALLQEGQANASAIHADRQDVDVKHAEVLAARVDVLAAAEAAGALGAGALVSRLDVLEAGKEDVQVVAIVGGVLTLDLGGKHTAFRVALNQAVTSIVYTNVPAGPVRKSWTVQFVGNGTGFAVAWHANTRHNGGTIPGLNTANGKVNSFVQYTDDGGASYPTFKSGET